MPKRRRCKDKLPHHEHEWGPGQQGRLTPIVSSLKGAISGGNLHDRWWCPGTNKEEPSGER